MILWAHCQALSGPWKGPWNWGVLKLCLHQLQDKSCLPTPADSQPAASHVSILLQVGQAEGGHTLATGRLGPGLQHDMLILTLYLNELPALKKLYFTRNPDLRLWLKTPAALSSAPPWQPGSLFQFSSCFYSNLCSLPSPPGIWICKPALWYQFTTKGCANTQQAIDVYTWNFVPSLYWMLDKHSLVYWESFFFSSRVTRSIRWEKPRSLCHLSRAGLPMKMQVRREQIRSSLWNAAGLAEGWRASGWGVERELQIIALGKPFLEEARL